MSGRPRIHNKHLPRGVLISHGAYYLVRQQQWIWLGRTEAEALQRLAEKDHPLPRVDQQILRYAELVLVRARQNAKGRRGLPFTLEKADARTLLERAGWKCSVTRAPFSLEKVGRHRPYAPSIDRIDNAVGYTLENCRVVCVATNIAMNVWGEAVLHRLAAYMVRPVLGSAET